MIGIVDPATRQGQQCQVATETGKKGREQRDGFDGQRVTGPRQRGDG